MLQNTSRLLLRFALALPLGLLLPGCSADRWNHWHSQENAAKAKKAESLSNEVFDDGLRDDILSNLAAERTLREAYGASATEFYQTANLYTIEDRSWDTLKDELIYELGSADSSEHELLNQISERRILLAKAVSAYAVLVKGERARIALFQKSRKQLASGNKPTQEDEMIESSTLGLVFELREAISNYWEDEERRRELLSTANGLRRLLIEAAEASVDPVSVYSLVAITGESTDLQPLRDYVQALEEQINSKQDDVDTLLNNIQVALGRSAGLVEPQETAEASQATEEFADAYGEMLALFSGDDDEIDLDTIVDDVLDATEALELEIDLDRARKIAGTVSTFAVPIGKLLSDSKNRTLTADDLAPVISLVSGEIGMGDLTSRIDKVLDEGCADEDDSTPCLRDEIRKGISDLTSQSAEAKKRLIAFLDSLQRLHQHLHEENVRHYSVLSAIAAEEIARWTAMHRYAFEIGIYYQIFEHDHNNTDASLRSSALFTDGETINFWNHDLEGDSPGAHHPLITHEMGIMHSIRLMAETGWVYQAGSPSEVDPSGWHTQRSVRRLVRTMQILLVYQMATSINEQRSRSNQISLISETKEHAARVEDIVIASAETEIRYGIGELVAFHSTGVTESDVRLLVSVVQNGLLAWIGSEVD